jgi:hypothetical protein
MLVVKWSFSGLKDFINCPRQYHEVKILQRFVKKVSQQMQYGTEVHKAFEDYARDGKELPKFYQKFKPQVDALLDIPGTRYLEHKMALDDALKPCEFDAPEYWVRGIVDLMIIDESDKTAFIVDYKTGSSRYADPKQLKLMALMAFTHFPSLQKIKAGLSFVAHNQFIPEDYVREDIPVLWNAFKWDLERLNIAARDNNWPANPTALCRYCPVVTCEFNKE